MRTFSHFRRLAGPVLLAAALLASAQSRAGAELARPSRDAEVTRVRACARALLAAGPTAAALRAEVMRAGGAEAGPPPLIDMTALDAWLRDAAVVHCRRTLKVAPDAA